MSMNIFNEQVAEVWSRTQELRRQAAEVAAHMPTPLLPQAFAELQASLEELRVAEEEMRVQNEALADARRQVEDERRRYQELFEFAPDGYLVTDTSGKILEANRAAAALLGISPRYLRGKVITIAVAEADIRDFRQRLMGMAEAQEAQSWEMRLRRRHGSDFHSALTVGPVRDPEGRLTGLRWMLRDVTERWQTKEQVRQLNLSLEGLLCDLELRVEERTAELAAAKAQMETILESISDAFYTLDEHSCFTYVNPKAAEIWGRERAALIGRSIWETFPVSSARSPISRSAAPSGSTRPYPSTPGLR